MADLVTNKILELGQQIATDIRTMTRKMSSAPTFAAPETEDYERRQTDALERLASKNTPGFKTAEATAKALTKGNLAQKLAEQRSVSFYSSILKNFPNFAKIFVTMKEIAGNTSMAFERVKTAWSTAFNRIFGQIIESFGPIIETSKAILGWLMSLGKTIFNSFREFLRNRAESKLSKKVEDGSEEIVEEVSSVRTAVMDMSTKMYKIGLTQMKLQKEILNSGLHYKWGAVHPKEASERVYGVGRGDIASGITKDTWGTKKRKGGQSEVIPTEAEPPVGKLSKWTRFWSYEQRVKNKFTSKVKNFIPKFLLSKKEDTKKTDEKKTDEKKTSGGILSIGKSFLGMIFKLLPFAKIFLGIAIAGLFKQLFPGLSSKIGAVITDPKTWENIFGLIGKVFSKLQEWFLSPKAIEMYLAGITGTFNAIGKLLTDTQLLKTVFVDFPGALLKGFMDAWTNADGTGKLALGIAAGAAAAFAAKKVWETIGMTVATAKLTLAGSQLIAAATKLMGVGNLDKNIPTSTTNMPSKKPTTIPKSKIGNALGLLGKASAIIGAATIGVAIGTEINDFFKEHKMLGYSEKPTDPELEKRFQESILKNKQMMLQQTTSIQTPVEKPIEVLSPVSKVTAPVVPPSKKFLEPSGVRIRSKMAPEIKKQIQDAAKKYGIPEADLLSMAQLESGGNPLAKSSTGAKGIFQFTGDTAKRYNLKDPYNASENIDAGARLYKDNYDILKKKLGRNPTPQEIYLAHNQGARGAYEILKAADTGNENFISAKVRKNMELQGAGFKGITASSFISKMTTHLSKAANDIGTELSSTSFAATKPTINNSQKLRDAEYNKIIARAESEKTNSNIEEKPTSTVSINTANSSNVTSAQSNTQSGNREYGSGWFGIPLLQVNMIG